LNCIAVYKILKEYKKIRKKFLIDVKIYIILFNIIKKQHNCKIVMPTFKKRTPG